MSPIVSASPVRTARIAGAFYLITFIVGFTALLGSGRLQFVANVIGDLAYLAVTVLFYGLFKPVNKTVSLVAALFSLAGIVSGLSSLFNLPHLPINNVVVFGLYCLSIGYLVLESTFLPHVLGVLMMIAGLGWLTFLFPSLAASLRPYNMAPGIIGEAALMIWLLVVGVNAARWTAQASFARTR